jgi:hypothetical protein
MGGDARARDLSRCRPGAAKSCRRQEGRACDYACDQFLHDGSSRVTMWNLCRIRILRVGAIVAANAT